MIERKDIESLRNQEMISRSCFMEVERTIVYDILDLYEAARFASGSYEFPVPGEPENECDFYMRKMKDLVG